MSEPIDKPENAKPAKEPGALTLGQREHIGLMGGGLKPRLEEGGRLYAWVYTGFFSTDDQKHFIKRSTKTADQAEAMKFVTEVLIPQLQRAWDLAAAAAGHTRAGTPRASNGQAHDRTAEQLLVELEERWDNLTGKRRQTHKGYITESRAFRRICGQLARRDPSEFTEEECEEIRDTRLEEFGPDTTTPDQAMGNARVVLASLQGFPSKYIDLFRPAKRGAGQKHKRDFTFGLSERRAIWLWLVSKDASWEQRGMVYKGIFGCMHIRDAALSRWEQLREARDATCRRERVKSGNPFRFFIPPMLSDWAYEGSIDPKAVYMRPDLLFSAEEMAANPTINHTRLSKEQEEDRATNAAAKLRKSFDALLKRLGIKRPGLSYRSFRHTNISEWEAGGVPRSVGMCVTGQSEEKNYIGYIAATVMQLMSLSEFTLDFWRFPGRRVFVTITQAVHALMRLIIKSELRQRRAARSLHDEVRAMRVELQRLQPSPNCDACGRRCTCGPPLALGHHHLIPENCGGNSTGTTLTANTNYK